MQPQDYTGKKYNKTTFRTIPRPKKFFSKCEYNDSVQKIEKEFTKKILVNFWCPKKFFLIRDTQRL